jgi:hypothetical protein
MTVSDNSADELAAQLSLARTQSRKQFAVDC